MALPAPLQNFVDGPKLPKVVLGVLGLVALCAVAYFFLISPVQERIAELVQKKAKVTADVTKARAQVAEIERFRRELLELEKRLVSESDPLVKQDLEILIHAARRSVKESKIDDENLVPYANPTNIVL